MKNAWIQAHPVQDDLCASGICHDMRGGHAVSIHQPTVAAGLRNGIRLCLWMALEPHAGKPHIASCNHYIMPHCIMQEHCWYC